MKKLAAIIFPLLMVGALILAGCGKNAGGNTASGPGPMVTSLQMNGTNFVLHAVQVKANQSVTLDNTVGGGGTHFICVGTGTGGSNTCDASGSGPSKLYGGNGLQVSPGNSESVTFANTGKYHIICTVHPGMYVDVTVVS
jgi:plastocyanin